MTKRIYLFGAMFGIGIVIGLVICSFIPAKEKTGPITLVACVYGNGELPSGYVFAGGGSTGITTGWVCGYTGVDSKSPIDWPGVTLHDGDRE